jgi:DeoR/GlpR family transcriptional regulator of sugar metabolism
MIQFLKLQNLTVITSSLRVADSFAQTSACVFLLGGRLQPKSITLGGGIAEKNIGSFHAYKMFSSAGIDRFGVISDFFTKRISP